MSEETQDGLEELPALRVGQRVLYVPHIDHHLDADFRGEALFAFHFAQESPGRHRAGDRVPLKQHGALKREGDHLVTGSGHRVQPGKPLAPWPATVRKLNADGSAELDIRHPFGAYTMHVPDSAAVLDHEYDQLANIILSAANALGANNPAAAELLRDAHWSVGRAPIESRFDALMSKLKDQGLLPTLLQGNAHLSALLAAHPRKVPGVPHDPTGVVLHSFHPAAKSAADGE